MTNPPRPRTTSRTSAPRPRKLAGQGPSTPVEPPPDPAPVDEIAESARTRAESAELSTGEVVEGAEVEVGPRSSLFAGSRVTLALLVVIVLLTVATLGMAGYLWLGDDDTATAAAPPPAGEIAVPEGRPILLPWADAQAAAAAAAEAATTALARSWKDYDAQLDEAVQLMTPSFAEEFRTTATDAKAGVVDGKLDIAVRVIAQSVVRANTTEVQALLFLDQYTTSNGDQEGTTVSPYRVLVTVVNTDGGWLVSDLQTK